MENARFFETIKLNKRIPSADRVGKMINQICGVMCYANCNPMKLSLQERALWYIKLCKDYEKKYGSKFEYIEESDKIPNQVSVLKPLRKVKSCNQSDSNTRMNSNKWLDWICDTEDDVSTPSSPPPPYED